MHEVSFAKDLANGLEREISPVAPVADGRFFPKIETIYLDSIELVNSFPSKETIESGWVDKGIGAWLTAKMMHYPS
jgi:hypothetical protein